MSKHFLRGFAALLLLGLLAAPAARGQTPARLPADLALLPANTVALASLRPTELLRHPGGDLLKLLAGPDFLAKVEKESLLGVPPAEVERVTLVAVQEGKAALVVRTRKPYDRHRLLKALGSDLQKKTIRAKTVHIAREGNAVWQAGKDVFVVTIDRNLKGLTALLAEGNQGPTALAAPARLVAAGRHALVIALDVAEVVRGEGASDLLRTADLSDEDRRFARQNKPTRDWIVARLPVALLPYKPLMLASTATLLVRPGDEIDVEVQLAFAGALTAADGETSLLTARYVGREVLPRLTRRLKERFPAVAAALTRAGQAGLKGLRIERAGNGVKASGQLKLGRADWPKVAAALEQRAVESRNKGNMRRLLVAMHTYNDAVGSLPAAALYDKDGKACLSWRVLLLPHLGKEAARLYKEFRLDESWDSPHNKKLLPKMPKVFAPVAGKPKEPHSTYYQVFTGPNTPFPGRRGPRIPRDFPDGTSNTFLIVEAADAVPWTRPADLVVDPKKPPPKLGGRFPGLFHVALADGHVVAVKQKVPERLLRLLIDPSDGQPLDWTGWVAD
jgi:hypothetical protein